VKNKKYGEIDRSCENRHNALIPTTFVIQYFPKAGSPKKNPGIPGTAPEHTPMMGS